MKRVVPLVYTPIIYTPKVKSEYVKKSDIYCGMTWVVWIGLNEISDSLLSTNFLSSNNHVGVGGGK